MHKNTASFFSNGNFSISAFRFILGLILLNSGFALADSAEIQIKGMHCGGCVMAVKENLCKLPGIKNCEVQVGSASLQSEDGKSLDQESVKKAISEAGYEMKSFKKK